MAEKEEAQPNEGESRTPKRPSVEDIVETSDANIIAGVVGDDNEDAEDASAEPESETPSGSAPEDSDKQPRKSRRDRKIKTLTRKLYAREDQIRALEEELEGTRAELRDARQSTKPAKKPRSTDYDNDEDFVEAYRAWEKSERDRAQDGKPAPRKSRDPLNDEIVAFVKEGEDELGEDFKKAVKAAQREDWVCSKAMTEYMLDSDQGHELFVYFAENPDVAEELARTRKTTKLVQRFMEIETELMPDSRPPERRRDDKGKFVGGNNETKSRKTTRAPPPGPKQEGGQGRQPVNPNRMAKSEDARSGDLGDYMKWRRKVQREGGTF